MSQTGVSNSIIHRRYVYLQNYIKEELELRPQSIFNLFSSPLNFGSFFRYCGVHQAKSCENGWVSHSPSRWRTDSSVKAGVTHCLVR